jgi:hypothetical protein
MNSIQQTASFTLPDRLERIFQLFTPEGEKLWAPGWDYTPAIMDAEFNVDYVFLTGSHDHASTHAIWLVKRYEPDKGLIAYYRVEPGDKVGVVTVQCSEHGPDRTRVNVTYKYIPLTEKGQSFAAGYTEQAHRNFIAQWRKLLEDYLSSS